MPKRRPNYPQPGPPRAPYVGKKRRGADGSGGAAHPGNEGSGTALPPPDARKRDAIDALLSLRPRHLAIFVWRFALCFARSFLWSALLLIPTVPFEVLFGIGGIMWFAAYMIFFFLYLVARGRGRWRFVKLNRTEFIFSWFLVIAWSNTQTSWISYFWAIVLQPLKVALQNFF